MACHSRGERESKKRNDKNSLFTWNQRRIDGGEGEEGEDEAAGAAESLFKKWDRPTQPTRTPSPTHRTAHPWSAKRGAMERGLPTSDRAASILPSSLPPCSKTRKKSAQLTNQRGGVEAQGRVPEIALVRDAQPMIGRGVLVPAGGGDKRVQPSRNKRDDPLEKQIRQVAGDRPAIRPSLALHAARAQSGWGAGSPSSTQSL